MGVVALALAMVLRYGAWQFGKGLSVFLFLGSAFWYLFVSLGLIRHGVQWESDSPETNRTFDLALMLLWYAVTAVVVWHLRRRNIANRRPAAARQALGGEG